MNLTAIDFRYWNIPAKSAGTRWLGELRLQETKRQVVVFVLDHSDSCPAPVLKQEQLAKLLGPCRRETLAWIYQLSDTAPLDSGTTTLAHLIDGSYRLDEFQGESSDRKALAARGSYFAPTLTAINERRVAEQVESLTIFLLTDGKLLDCGPLAIPAGISIYGITNVEEMSDNPHWQRVLPLSRLCQAREPLLRKAFAALAFPFHGSCELSLKQAAAKFTWQQLQLDGARLSPLLQNTLAWNSLDRPIYLVFESPSDQQPDFPLTISCRRTNESARLLGHASAEQPPAAAIAIIEQGSKQLVGEQPILLDLTNASESFAAATAAVQLAKELATKKASWLDGRGHLLPWPDAQRWAALYAQDSKPVSSAMICVSFWNQTGEVVRLQLLGLDLHTPFVVQPEHDLGRLWGLTEALHLHFCQEDSRWMLQLGSAKGKELNPLGSQLLNIPTSSKAIHEVEFLFSGSLK